MWPDRMLHPHEGCLCSTLGWGEGTSQQSTFQQPKDVKTCLPISWPLTPQLLRPCPFQPSFLFFLSSHWVSMHLLFLP